MTIDTSPAYSPGWWLNTLLVELGSRQDRLTNLYAYYRGEQSGPWGPTNTEAYQRFQSKARTNWASLIVEATRERMKVVGFRTGADGDDLGDREAGRIWRANDMDVQSLRLHRAKLAMGDAYAMVGPVDPRIGAPRITVEDPRTCITSDDPADHRRPRAALKVVRDTVMDRDVARLFLPRDDGRAVMLTATRDAPRQIESTGFDWTTAGFEWAAQGVLFPAFPVVRFPNRAGVDGVSLGEFEDVIDDIDRIDLMILQRMMVAVMQAFRQRAVKGDLPHTDPETGEDVDWASLLKADPGALWNLPAGIELWESSGVDLTPILESVKADVRDLAATTRTPMFYITPDAAGGSAEGASLQREGLIFKARDRIEETTDPWGQTMATAFLMAGDAARADRSQIEVIWQPPERFSLAERYDAAAKAQAAGVPWRTVMLDVLQFTPPQVDKMEAQRVTDSFALPPAGVPAAG